MIAVKKNATPLLKLRVHYEALRASEKRVADYILNHPNEAMFLSITELAKRCNTSETSVIRLCKAVGYNGYQSFRMDLACSESQADSTNYSHIHEDVDVNDSISTMIKKVLSTNIRAIEDTMKVLNPEQMERAFRAIAQTDRLEFYGMGGSGCVAIDAHHKFFKYGMRCIAYVDSHMQAMSAATMQPGDVVVAISNSGATKELIRSVEVAKNAGATTICITGSAESPLAEVCDIVLIATAKERAYKPEPMSTRIAQLSVIDVLSVAVAMTRQEEILHILQKTRRAVDKAY